MKKSFASSSACLTLIPAELQKKEIGKTRKTAAACRTYALMLGLLTNAANVLLVSLVAIAPLLPRPHKPGHADFDFWLRSLLGIGIGVALAEGGKHFQVWPGRPSFPSGHETLALAAGTCLAVRNPRWLALALPLAAFQAWALVAGHFHRPVDIAGALATGILPPLGCHLLRKPPRPNHD